MRVYMSNVLVIFLVTLIGGVVIGIFGGTILGVFGKDFTKGKTILQVLMISAIFESVSIALFQHLQSQGKLWLSFFLINVPKELLFVILAFMAVPIYGALGLSAAYTLSLLLTLVIICVVVYFELFSGKDHPKAHF